ncbi:Ribonuclease HIII-domain protein [Mycoplasmoides gallisepticum str. R(low)]|uniref:Ribonuclease n=1 Tax=Mycoplasmoides gallisepticum (strain R(low / passage 15 / clone 2)) TaxID=710127 RepID=Q7NBD1_MYCGA|nr:Ribonuclease HIII-domain protein [Mycoplasmoides gallisepticum str. R(low)]ADC30549.1 Ribonuclease HIII-domain protein [Mycoplasmoides gallisepticum str. R(high)]
MVDKKNHFFNFLVNLTAYLFRILLKDFVFFKQRYQINNLIVLDQFVNQNKYYQYLTDFKVEPIIKIDLMEEKAESKYLSVAVASILARAFYLELCQKLLNKINYKDDYKKMLVLIIKPLNGLKNILKIIPILIGVRSLKCSLNLLLSF